MRIAVIGLGGVGGYIAAYLSKSKQDVVGFARGNHLTKIQENGLEIIEDSSRFIQQLETKELSEADGYFDVVLFCVKSYDLEKSYNEISKHIDSKTIILSFSNGVNNGDILRNLSDSIVLDACIYILSHIEQSGVIRKNGDIFAAVFGGDTNAANSLKLIFDIASLRAKIPSDIKTALYKKYIFISAFACLTTYFDESIVQVTESHMFEATTVLNEIANVAFAQGIDIKEEVQQSIKIASSLPYDSSTSMHLYFKNKKTMEIESLCAYIVKEGEKHSVPTPFMKTIYDKLV